MIAKKTIIGRFEAPHYAIGALVSIVAALFVLSFAGTTAASPYALGGKVVEVDNSSQTITLSPAGTGDEMVFNLDRDPSITMCDKVASFNDIKAGDEVTLQYREESDGHWIAEGIDLSRRC